MKIYSKIKTLRKIMPHSRGIVSDNLDTRILQSQGFEDPITPDSWLYDDRIEEGDTKYK